MAAPRSDGLVAGRMPTQPPAVEAVEERSGTSAKAAGMPKGSMAQGRMPTCGPGITATKGTHTDGLAAIAKGPLDPSRKVAMAPVVTKRKGT
jgi:hypothetical protein